MYSDQKMAKRLNTAEFCRAVSFGNRGSFNCPYHSCPSSGINPEKL